VASQTLLCTALVTILKDDPKKKYSVLNILRTVSCKIIILLVKYRFLVVTVPVI